MPEPIVPAPEGSGDIARRREALEAEMRRLDEIERQRAADERAAAEAQRAAALEPEQREKVDELTRRAREALEREPPMIWAPNKPDSNHPEMVVGEVTAVEPNVGPSPNFGTFSGVVWLRTPTGEEWRVWADHGGALWPQIVRLQIQPGDVIAVGFNGKRASRNDPTRMVNDFRLRRLDDDQPLGGRIDYDALPAAGGTGGSGDSGPVVDAVVVDPDDDIPF